ncbi:MAG: hypothetical protein H7Y62_04795 [Hyphomicrobium sp.]|nr:hypothetical protein [Hyphomicrobium sp.]
MVSRTEVVTWLLDGDPAIRWQTMRDLTDAPAAAVGAERLRVAVEGWGAELLARQAADGHWNDETEHGWMTTTDALQLLRDLGADPADGKVRGAIGRVTDRITWWQLDGRPFFDGETEACINGRILAAGAYFGAVVDPLLGRLLAEQLEDGGWNCEAPASKRSSFHSTICVLEGLLEYEKAHGASAAVTDARVRAEDYLLQRRLLRSLSSGEVINRRWTSFLFPPNWQYDVLRGLDYLRRAGVKPDERVAEAVALVEQKRGDDGRWSLDGIHPDHTERLAFDLETAVGEASRWNTLRALRVLDWARG